jgi:hypothetical protein
MHSFAFHSDGNSTRDDDVGPVNSNGLLVLVMFTDYYDTSSGIMVAGIQTKTENKEKTNLYFTTPPVCPLTAFNLINQTAMTPNYLDD